MTQKLYYQNTEKTDFSAEVRSITKTKNGWEVELDRTYFYPEGGGQPADKGTLDGIDVLHVSKRDGRILHLLPDRPRQRVVTAELDWNHRFHFMQQHTGQHLISAALKRIGDYNTVSVHMGHMHTTVEIDAASISPEDIERVENSVNSAINANLEVIPVWTDTDHLDEFPLRRPSKVKGEVRVVNIGDFDCVACGGIHLARTGGVGLVKAIGVEKIRNHARTIWAIGNRAFEDYRIKHEVVSHLVTSLSARPPEILDAVNKLQEDVVALKFRAKGLESRLASLLAKNMAKTADRQGELRVITEKLCDESSSLVRQLVEDLSKNPGLVACILNIKDDRIMWYLCHGPEAHIDMVAIKNTLMPMMDAKGGGKPPIWQGMGRDASKVDRILAEFKRCIQQQSTQLLSKTITQRHKAAKE